MQYNSRWMVELQSAVGDIHIYKLYPDYDVDDYVVIS